MVKAPSGDDRLPWLDAPRPARPARAARRARTPLLVLLGLFLASAIAVMAFLAGRSTAPDEALSAPPLAPVSIAPVTAPPSAPTQISTPPAPGPALTPPTSAAAAPRRAAPSRPRATRPTARPVAGVRRPSATLAPQPPVAAVVQPAPAPALARPASTAYAVPQRRTTWPARPFSGPRGRVVQLGAHLTQQKADAAWWRLARVYPYVTTLPRVLTWSGPSPGRPRYYRVRIAAGSNREARALCRNLVRLNRACAVV